MVETFKQAMLRAHPEFIIDQHNEKAMDILSLWITRDESFEKIYSGMFLDKGFLLIGATGTGKTNLMNYFNRFLKHLQSNYNFKFHIVWEFADSFSKEGVKCFEGINSGNRYFDELCMIDSRLKEPKKEIVQYFGNKIIVGEELILMRYNALKFNGYQSHFSTNATLDELKFIYGERAYSRLKEMCNVIVLGGDDKRGTTKPHILNNKNSTPEKKVIPESELVDAIPTIIQLLKKYDEKNKSDESKEVEFHRKLRLSVASLRSKGESEEAIQKYIVRAINKHNGGK